MKNYLWKIQRDKLNNTNLALYSDFIKKNYKQDFDKNFDKIWKWSVDNPKIFWKSVWDFTKVIGDPGNIFLIKPMFRFRRSFNKTGLRIKKKGIRQQLKIKDPLDINYNSDTLESIIKKISVAP